jgi:hypothetical protein
MQDQDPIIAYRNPQEYFFYEEALPWMISNWVWFFSFILIAILIWFASELLKKK